MAKRLAFITNPAHSPDWDSPIRRSQFVRTNSCQEKYQRQMNRLTIAIPYTEDKQFETLARQLISHPLVEEVLCLSQNAPLSLPTSLPKDMKSVTVDTFFSC